MKRRPKNPHAELCAWANGLRADSPKFADPVEVPAGQCPSPINGKLTVEECQAAGQCGCDAQQHGAEDGK